MHVVNTLAPIFLVIALGAWLRRSGALGEAFFAQSNRLAYWVALPCLLFLKVARASDLSAGLGSIFGILMAGMVACLALGYLAAWLLRLPVDRWGTLVQGAYRGNLAYVGLAVVFYAFASFGEQLGSDVQARAAVVLAPAVPIYNVVAVVVLLAGQHRLNFAAVRKTLVAVTTNPLLIGTLLGAVWSLADLPLPESVSNGLDILSGLALPLALLGLGGTMVTAGLRGRVVPSLAASVIKTWLAPLVGLGAAVLLGVGGQERTVALIFLACPTAVSSFVFAEQMNGDDKLAAAIVVVSTLLSVAAFTAILATM